MIVSIEKPGTPEELVHYGKKGMKWGVRKAYAQSASARGATQRRVGEGKGSTVDKLRVHGTTSYLSLSRAALTGRPGFKGAALVRAERTEAHVQRIETGRATAHDVLRMAGTISMNDIYRGLAPEK